LLDDLGYRRIIQFDAFPCEVYFHDKKLITLAIGKGKDWVWLKASKHFFIKAMEKVGDSGLYSRLQDISAFMNYLKQNVPEFHCTTYYISQITPKIVLNNFREKPKLAAIVSEEDELKRKLGARPLDEQKVLDMLAVVKAAEPDTASTTLLESTLRGKLKMKDRSLRLKGQVQVASSILNDWLEKGHAISLLWNISTQIHVTNESKLKQEIASAEEELSQLERLSLRSRAHQLHLWIGELQDPSYAYYAEVVGLFHPATVRLYKEIPELQNLADSIEEMFNARLVTEIRRTTGYVEEQSTAIAEAKAAFLRQIQAVDQFPRVAESKLLQRPFSKPVYFGLIGVMQEEGLQDSSTPFMLEEDDLAGHVLITGITGCGKTRVGQIIAETTSLHVPTIILDPVGEFTGLIKPNANPKHEAGFDLPPPRSCPWAKIYTLDSVGIKLQANILAKPEYGDEKLQAEERARVLMKLAGDKRFLENFREILLEFWTQGRELDFETFLESARRRTSQKLAPKLDGLYNYKQLMSKTGLSVEDMLRDKLTIISLTNPEYSDEVKLAFIWIILKSIMNHFMAGPHCNELKALVIADEIHKYYREGAASEAATTLEEIVKTCRQRGLGVVMLTQSIKDLPEPLTQAHNRILMCISEGEIQMYGAKFGTDLARTVHNAAPRTGHVHLFRDIGTQDFWCHFRETLSSPEGASDEEITKHSIGDKLKTQFKEQQSSEVQEPSGTISAQEATPAAALATSELSEAELQFLDMLKNVGGTAKSELQMRTKLKWGQSKNRRIIQLLTDKKKIQKTESAGRTIIKLVDNSPHTSSLEKV
jgi:hypothetical protein